MTRNKYCALDNQRLQIAFAFRAMMLQSTALMSLLVPGKLLTPWLGNFFVMEKVLLKVLHPGVRTTIANNWPCNKSSTYSVSPNSLGGLNLRLYDSVDEASQK